jgi:hypothetical protein
VAVPRARVLWNSGSGLGEDKSKRVTGHGCEIIVASGHEYPRSLYGSRGEWHPVLEAETTPASVNGVFSLDVGVGVCIKERLCAA